MAAFEAVRDALAGKTTQWLKCNFVLPKTNTDKISFAATLPAETRGAATHFISHAYDYEFLKVVDAVRTWEARQPTGSGPFFYYFDLLVVNQHAHSERIVPFEVLRDTFASGVRGTGHTLLFLEWEADPRSIPRALTRAWCIFEVFSTLDAKASFQVIVSPEDEVKLEEAMVESFDDLAHRTCVVDAAKSSTREPQDLENIHRCITEGPGFLRVNQMVIEALNVWMVDTGRRALARIPDAIERATSTLQSALACLLKAQGDLAAAEPLLRGALEGFCSKLGASHPHALGSKNNLADLLRDKGELAEAERLVREAVDGYRRGLGDDHLDTLVAIENLAGLLQDQGKMAEAVPLYGEALAGFRVRLGDSHPNTLGSMNNLADVLKDQGKLPQAEALHREALAGFRRVLLDCHPSTLTSISNLGRLLRLQGKYEEAEALCREALDGRRRVLGDSHPLTLGSIDNLAQLLSDQGKLTEAELLYREALAGRRRVLGESHRQTLKTLEHLQHLLQLAGKSPQKLMLLTEPCQACASRPRPFVFSSDFDYN